MLSNLYIENIAVIEKTDMSFGPGFNVLSGETGAGKSIIINAINAVLGQRISKDVIRVGADFAFVSAEFSDISEKCRVVIENLGYKLEDDGSLIIQREINTSGRNVCKINGRPATVSTLKEIGSNLINIHGQHESYGLSAAQSHIDYIDMIGNLQCILSEYQASYKRLIDIKSELDDLNIDESEKMRKKDLLKYQVEELESAHIKIGELEHLNTQKNTYINRERIARGINDAKNYINGDEEVSGALSGVEYAYDALEEVSKYLPEIENFYKRIRDIAYELSDCAEELSKFSPDLEPDLNELQNIEERLDLIYKLGRKYGETEEEMLSFLEDCKKELEKIDFSEENKRKLEELFEVCIDETKKLASELSKHRKLISEKFSQAVKDELGFLDMPGVKLEILHNRCILNKKGCDEIQFLISTNPGEEPKPIAKIASGGELSRIMLAIKSVFAEKDNIDTLIFDEVDTGISGSAAQKVGLKLKNISKSRQVICVTHLAQIAAMADEHLLIEKNVKNDRTYTCVNRLSFDGRVHELARIIGGLNITELTISNATEMLNTNKNI